MRKRYLFFDIDGTLMTGGYENGYIPESTQKALRRLRENGHFLAIATGRAHFMAQPILQKLGFENMVSDGGYGVTIGGKLLGIRPLPKEPVITLVNECEALGLPWGLQVDDSNVRLCPDRSFLEFTKDVYLQTRIVPGLRPEDQEAIYKMYVACEYPTEFTLQTLNDLPWCRYHDNYFFVEPTYKAVGIKTVLDYYGADYADAVVFGDAENDLSMFTDDWTKVAMGNAVDELKAKADYVTTGVDEDGIWNACVHLGLI